MSILVIIKNDGRGTKEIGNYDVKVLLNNKLLHEQRIEGFKRRTGWKKLIGKITEKKKT